MAEQVKNPGQYTLEEILSQTHCWTECFQKVEHGGQLAAICERFSGSSEWLFVGCGSSYYLAQAAAATFAAVTKVEARAIPASELLLFPELVPTDSKNCVPVLISRSGKTSEMIRAAEYLEKSRNLRTLAITCATNQPLELAASATIRLPWADEKSTVMTRSFTSMLLVLQTLAADLANKPAFDKALHKLPTLFGPILGELHPRIREFVTSHDFADYVYLGQGPFYGLACESMLKLKEMSCSYAQVFHTLEFRHGPKAIVSPSVLVTFLLSEAGYEAEVDVLEEIKDLGATTLVIANAADQRAQVAADLLVELRLDLPEYARLAAYAFAGQLLGVTTGIKKGLDPDQPRHLSRVVMLEEEAGKPEHASF